MRFFDDKIRDIIRATEQIDWVRGWEVSYDKRYLISSLTTFAATFLLTGGVAIQNGALGNEAITSSAVVGVVMVALRAAVKAVIEGFAGSGDPEPTV